MSLTIFNDQQEIIGVGCFNDYPQGLRGKYDNLHENLWEEWLPQAFNLEGLPITSFNCLWMTFLHIDPNYINNLEHIAEKLLQSLYILQPQLEGVLYLKRGEVESLDDIEDAYRLLRSHFLEFKTKDSTIMEDLIGVSSSSKVYYSPKSHVNESLEIRMAR